MSADLPFRLMSKYWCAESNRGSLCEEFWIFDLFRWRLKGTQKCLCPNVEWAQMKLPFRRSNATINKTQPYQPGYNRQWLNKRGDLTNSTESHECIEHVCVWVWVIFTRPTIDHIYKGEESVTSHTQWHTVNWAQLHTLPLSLSICFFSLSRFWLSKHT